MKPVAAWLASVLIVPLALSGPAAAAAPGPKPEIPARAQPLPFAKSLLPEVVEMIRVHAMALAAERHAPRYASIALGKDEYVYSLLDRTFIRVIKDRYELPPWKLCGDWASVRIALLGESMETAAPETVWFLAYRDGQWSRVFQDEAGQFTRDGHSAEVPPYAVRCFNLDHRDLTD